MTKTKPTESNAVAKWVPIALGGAVAIGVFSAAANLYRPAGEGQIQECLSNGGCWDYQRGACEHEDQCRCTPARCVRTADGKLVLPADAGTR